MALLIIETGAIVANANSYATVEDLRGYARLRGATVPDSTTECEQLLIKAMDYLARQNFTGDRVSATQPLDWPRMDAEVEGWIQATNAIPRQLIQAQCALAIEAALGTDLMPTTATNATGPVVQETIGPITVAYANTGNVNRVPAVAKADVLLKTLLKRGGLFAVRA
jgi:hypothetical protein